MLKKVCICHSAIYNSAQNWLDSRVEDGRGGIKLRFPSPLIKPDVRNYRIRLTDWLHLKVHDERQT